ncbi:maternal B9.15 protein [Boleophthalmus pectinirostris]|uniref:maternal B9.15 protein n=1 Tax=Boleophthalmus pectinirostris TaxID=150288 RepID=UPI000A1C320B|nr:maternal B9.15 protein [Boleophthalmus pectinirostris]
MTMIREVKAGVNFLKRLVVARGKLEETKAELFAEKLQQHLCSRYDDHWYPDSPSKGQAFRCIRINNGVLSDEAVLKACVESELKPSDLGLPRELTLWIDPLEVCARSGENSRPFTVATFTEEDRKEESLKNTHEDSLSEESINLDTSDYHSATSSDCGSAASSDTEEESKDQEEEVKDGEEEGEPKKEKDVKKETAEGDAYTIAMVPRLRGRNIEGLKKVKYVRNMVPPSLQYYYQPTQVWSPYKKAPPVFLTTVCAPPPPPPQPLVGYYILPQPSPQFILPQASLQPWGAVKG